MLADAVHEELAEDLGDGYYLGMNELFSRHTDSVKKLTVKVDREGHYFGTNKFFSRHTDTVKKLTENVDRDRYHFGMNELVMLVTFVSMFFVQRATSHPSLLQTRGAEDTVSCHVSTCNTLQLLLEAISAWS